MTADHDSHDVVVVGHGVSGLSTALSAHEAGATPVVLEKSPRENRGGHTRFAGGIFRVPTEDPARAREELGLEETPERYTRPDFMRDLMDVSDGRADEELCRVLVDNAYDAATWLADRGVDFDVVDTTEEVGFGTTAGCVQADGEGAGVVAALSAALEAEGIDAHYGTEMREVLTDQRRAVEGVRAVADDGWRTYHADAVVVAAGSYVSSPEKRTRYFGREGDAYVVRGSRYNTGEALEAALDAGAMPGGQWGGGHQAMLDGNAPPVEGGRTRINGYQYGLLLNRRGERFVDEGEDFLLKTYAKFGQAVYDQPGHEAFVVFDDTVPELVVSQMDSDPLVADSLDGLLAELDLDAASARETVGEFNDATTDAPFDPDVLDGKHTEGLDPEKTNWAAPIDDPPYRCYPVTTGLTFAFGGLKITTDAAVLDTRGETLPGLWAVGNSTAEFFYGNYPGGSALMRGATFGRRAGRAAAESVLD